jgi:Mrp family chromosome partitioning ATPase
LPGKSQEPEPDFLSVAALLRRRWRVMVPFLALPLGVLAFSLSGEKRYSATATVLVHDEAALASDDPEREAATNVALLSLEPIERRAQRRLGGSEATADEVEAKQEGRSNLLHITATDPSPRRAARTADAFTREYVAFRRNAARRELKAEQRFLQRELAQLSRLESQGATGRSLRSRLRRLQFAESRQTVVDVVAWAETPSSPSSPRSVRNTLIGGVLGLFLAGAAAILFERLDPRLRTATELESALDRPVLALIRKSRALARSTARSGPPAPHKDDFIALRSHLRFSAAAGGDVRSVLITSAAAGDGKTTVAWNLAWAAAGPEARVLLLEADLRHPTLASNLGLQAEQGLAQVLDGEVSLQDVVRDIAAGGSEDGRHQSRIVSVAFAGRGSARSDDPSAWEHLAAAIKTAEHDFDLIVIDTPPMLFVPDAIPLASRVGGVVVVGRLGSTPRAGLRRLREELETIDAPLIGAVVNRVGRVQAYPFGDSYYARRA